MTELVYFIDPDVAPPDLARTTIVGSRYTDSMGQSKVDKPYSKPFWGFTINDKNNWEGHADHFQQSQLSNFKVQLRLATSQELLIWDKIWKSAFNYASTLLRNSIWNSKIL